MVAEASTDALRLAQEHSPDIALLDLEMPRADGLHAAMQIRADLPTRIILVTQHARPAVLRRALSAGVSGFVPKTTPTDRLAEIIRDVAAGERYVDSDIAASALTEDHCPLTDRELEVLSLTLSVILVAGVSVDGSPGTQARNVPLVEVALEGCRWSCGRAFAGRLPAEAFDVDRDGGEHMLQMGLALSSVAAAAHAMTVGEPPVRPRTGSYLGGPATPPAGSWAAELCARFPARGTN